MAISSHGLGADDPSQESQPHTTERVTPDEYQGSAGDHAIYSLHVATYNFALPYVAGSTVLDFGSGTGYGTAMLASRASKVVGVDVAPEAVAYAAARFQRPNLSFEQIEPVQSAPLPFTDGTFDVVVSFQVVEHIDDVDAYLREVRRVLRPGGTFLCVTPDRTHRLFPRQKPWNEFHITEYSAPGLAALLRSRFAAVECLGMTAPPHVIRHELKRYQRMRLVAYPFTFPGAPEWWRRFGIRAAKRAMRRRGPSTPAVQQDFGFGPEDVVVEAGAAPSVNIVAVARRDA